MDGRWLSHLKTEEERRKFKEYINGSVPLFDRLRSILEKELEEEKRRQRKVENYEKASWAFFQADSIGAQRALHKAIDLLPKEK